MHSVDYSKSHFWDRIENDRTLYRDQLIAISSVTYCISRNLPSFWVFKTLNSVFPMWVICSTYRNHFASFVYMHVPVFFLCNALFNQLKGKITKKITCYHYWILFSSKTISLLWSPSIASEGFQHFGECSEPTAFEPGGVVIVPFFDTGLRPFRSHLKDRQN